MTTSPELAADLATLANLDLHGLRVRWRKLVRSEAPDHLGRALLLRMLAYRLQARESGDLDAEGLRFLRSVERDRLHQKAAGTRRPKAVPKIAPVVAARAIKPGTLFLREHKGEIHSVTAVAGGFAWKGEVHGSLSEVAKAITGTNWSGPRFFGLSQAARAKSASGNEQGAAS